MSKRIRILSLLLTVLLLLASCGPTEASTKATTATEENPTTQGTTERPTTERPTTERPTTETPTTEAPTTEKPEDDDGYLQLGTLHEELQVAVLFPAGATFAMQQEAEALSDLLRTKYATELIYDYVDTPYEYDAAVVLCDVTVLPDGEEILSTLGPVGLALRVHGDRVYLFSNNDNISGLFALLMDSLERTSEELRLSSDADERAFLFPSFESETATLAGGAPYMTSELDMQYTYNGVSSEEVLAYCGLLEDTGYELTDENQIGKVCFYTYQLSRDRVIVQYNTQANFVRIGFTHGEFQPSQAKVEYEKLVDASIANLFRNERSGLGLIIQLEDGTFVILDGGFMGGLQGNAAGNKDRDALYNYLMDNKPAEHEKPIISAWLLTHAHGDHDDAITVFLDKYGDEVELEMFVHHFPDFLRHPCRDEGEGQRYSYYGQETLDMIRKMKPDATEWIVHSGQRMALAGAELEILYTCEDLYPDQPYGINDTNTTYRLTVGDKTVMLLGDSDSRANNQMALYYGEEIRSDILQLAHHSYNGEPLQYQLIDPKICFWANFSYVDTSVRPCNQFLLNTKWARTQAGSTVQGDRTHYYNNEDVRVYFKDIT